MTGEEMIAYRRQAIEDRRKRREQERARRRKRNLLLRVIAILVFIALLNIPLSRVYSGGPDMTAANAATAPADADRPACYRPAQKPGAAGVLAKTVWGEARGCSTTEQAAVVWCVLNRVDSNAPWFPDDIIGAATQDGQFHGYSPDYPVDPDILALVEDVLYRWSIEGECVGDVGRVLPAEYLFFTGDGTENVFTTEWRGGETWDWSLDSPYE